MNFNFRKIASAAASTLMVGSTVALAAAANYPAPFVSGGASDVAIVYGSNAGSGDVVGVIDITNSLNSFVSGNGGGGSTVTGEAYALFTSSSPLLLNASLNSVRSTVTETNLPSVLGDHTFTATSGSTADSTIEATFKIDVGSNPRVVFDKEPTSSDDPAAGILMGASAGDYLYNATVTFNKAVNFTDSDSHGERIDLFGQEFTIASATDSTDLVLFQSSEKINLNSDTNPSQEVTVGGETYVVELISATDSSATIRVTDSAGNTDQDEINEAASKKILGIEIAVDTADENNFRLTAGLIIGSSRIKLSDGNQVELGTEEDPIDGTQVEFTGGGMSPADLTGITVQVYAADGSNDFITPETAFVDPVFGNFKLDFAGLQSDTDRETINVGTSGNDKMVVSLSNWQGRSVSNFEWLNNESSAILADAAEWRIYVQEMATINESAYAMVGNEDDGYLVKLRTLSNSSSTTPSDDRVIFENVFDTTQTWEATITDTEGSGTIDIGGKQYTVSYIDDRDGDNDEHVRLNYPDSTGQNMVVYPTVETSKGAKFAFYEPLTINLDSWDGAGANAAGIMIPDGDGFTTVTTAFHTDTSQFLNFTFGSTTTSINATTGGTASGIVGPLNWTFNVAADSGTNTTTLYVNDVSTGEILNPAIILWEEQDDANTYEALIVQTGGGGDSNNGIGISDVDFTWNSDTAMDGSAYGASGLQYESNDDLYAMMDVWGTLVTTDQSTSDQYTATISYPTEQVIAEVFVAEESATITGGSSGSVTSTGIVSLTDREVSSASDKNLIVVGGSCINSVAASLLGSTSPICGSAFTDATGVGAGSYLIESFTSPFASSKVATLVAGYDAGDTSNAVTYLRTQSPSTAVGDKYVGTTGTSATLQTA